MSKNTKYRQMTGTAAKKCLAAVAVLLVMPLAAMAFQQRPGINVNATEVPVADIFKQIEAQTGYSFAFNRSAFDASRPVTVHAAGADIKDVLNNVLKGSGFSYILSGNHIILLPEKEQAGAPAVTVPVSPRAQARQQSEYVQRDLIPEIQIAATQPPVVREQPQAVSLPDLPVVKAEDAYVEVVDQEVFMVIPGQQVVAIDMAPRVRRPAELRTPNIPESPRWALKTNLLFDATTTMNLGFELRISPKWTMELTGSYNPWSWPDNRKWKSIIVQPEFRWWLCDPFAGHFLGVHAHWAHYNWGNLPFGSLRNNRYQGDLAGVGVSYGYSWYLGRRWALEATIGVGYAYMWYQRFDGEVCGNCYGWEHKNYVGITKLGLSLSFLIK